MYNNNILPNKYSFSQRNIPILNTVFTSDNYTYNYFNDQSPINKQKRSFNDFEINKIIESCKKNLSRLKNTYIIKNDGLSNKNNIIFNDYNNNCKYNYNNCFQKSQKNLNNYNFDRNDKLFKNLPSNNIHNINYNYFNYLNKNKIGDNKLNQRIKNSLSRNNNFNINNYFNSDYQNKENNIIHNNNNNQTIFQGFSLEREFYNNKDLEIKRNKNGVNNKQQNKNNNSKKMKNNSKDKVRIPNIEQEKYKQNYLTLVNDLKNLKSTVVNYKKTNLELKKQIQILNNKIQMLSKNNNNQTNNLNNNKNEDEIREKCYIKKRINSYRGKINNKENDIIIKKHINNMRIFPEGSPTKINSNFDIKNNLNFEDEDVNNKYINRNTCYNSIKDINKYIEKRNKSQKNIKIKDKFKSRNLSDEFRIAKYNTSNFIEEYSNSSLYINNNINTSGVPNPNGKIDNVSEIIYNNTINSFVNNNHNEKKNSSKKDEIIEKRIFLKKKNNKNFDQVKNNYRTTSCSSNPDIKDLYKITKNNNLDISNCNQYQFPKNENEIIINFNKIIGQNKKPLKNKSYSNLQNNYVYQKKTKKIKSHSLNKKEIKNDDSESNEIIKIPLNSINISPVKNENSKSFRILDSIQNIDKNNLNKNYIIIKKNKNAILQRLLKNNHKNNIFDEIENNNLFLFGIDNQNNFIQFDIGLKHYSICKIHQINDLSNSFYKDYIYNTSILLNTLKGLYILTGMNTNILYYYNIKKRALCKICKFNFGHNKGGLLLNSEKNGIFAFSGQNTKKCELYSFINKKIIEIPDLNIDRTNASYCIINNKIFCLFGYSCNNSKYLNYIEMIDYKKLDKWENIYINIRLDFIIERCINISFNSDIIYLFIEGKKYKEDVIGRIFCLYDINKKEINKLNNLIIEEFKDRNCIWEKSINKKLEGNEFYFEKISKFIELPIEMNNNFFDKNCDNITVSLDNKNNAIFFYNNQLKIEIYRKFI